MSTEQVILNLDNIKPDKKFLEFKNKKYEILYLTLSEASEVLKEMNEVENKEKLYLFILEKCIPSIIPIINELNDNQSKAVVAKVLQICFRIDLKTSIDMLNTDSETVKKK